MLRPAVAALAAFVACTSAGAPDGRRPDRAPSSIKSDRAATVRRPGKPPNILIVITDDQRAKGTLGVMPQTRRWFQQEGTTYTKAFVTTPLCCPSRASVLTGRYAHNHGVHTNYDPSPLDGRSTLPHWLKRAGYRTAIAGKYLNSWDLSKRPPYFDRWAIEDAYDYYDTRFNINGRQRDVPGYLTRFISKQSTAFLREFEREDSKPWLLYIAPLAPHEPFTPEPRYAELAVPKRKSNPAIARGPSGKPPFVRELQVGRTWTYQLPRKQLRTLKSVDDLVGRVFAKLQRLGEDEETLAFFISDNGYLWGEHGIVEKRVPYTPAIKIPLLARWPGHIAAGRSDSTMVANIDIAPTILDAVGIAGERTMFDGQSLLDPGRRHALLFEYWSDPGVPRIPAWASIRTERYQYIEYYAEDDRTVAFREYYDLSRDPWQLTNLLADQDDDNDPKVRTLSRKLRAMRRCEGAACR